MLQSPLDLRIRNHALPPNPPVALPPIKVAVLPLPPLPLPRKDPPSDKAQRAPAHALNELDPALLQADVVAHAGALEALEVLLDDGARGGVGEGGYVAEGEGGEAGEVVGGEGGGDGGGWCRGGGVGKVHGGGVRVDACLGCGPDVCAWGRGSCHGEGGGQVMGPGEILIRCKLRMKCGTSVELGGGLGCEWGLLMLKGRVKLRLVKRLTRS